MKDEVKSRAEAGFVPACPRQIRGSLARFLTLGALLALAACQLDPAAGQAATQMKLVGATAPPVTPIRYPTLPPEWTATWTPTPTWTPTTTPSATPAPAAAPYTGQFNCYGDEHGLGAYAGHLTIDPAGTASLKYSAHVQNIPWTYNPSSNTLTFANNPLLATAVYYPKTGSLVVVFLPHVTLPHADLGEMGCQRVPPGPTGTP